MRALPVVAVWQLTLGTHTYRHPPTTTTDTTAAAKYNYDSGGSVKSRFSDDDCVNAYRNFMCYMNFPRCNDAGESLLLCRSVCENFFRACGYPKVMWRCYNPEYYGGKAPEGTTGDQLFDSSGKAIFLRALLPGLPFQGTAVVGLAARRPPPTTRARTHSRTLTLWHDTLQKTSLLTRRTPYPCVHPPSRVPRHCRRRCRWVSWRLQPLPPPRPLPALGGDSTCWFSGQAVYLLVFPAARRAWQPRCRDLAVRCHDGRCYRMPPQHASPKHAACRLSAQPNNHN